MTWANMMKAETHKMCERGKGVNVKTLRTERSVELVLKFRKCIGIDLV